MKTCFKCNKQKDLSFFYKHPAMRDGHLNKCKECTKADVSDHRKSNIDKIRKYDRDRGSLAHRKELSKRVYQNLQREKPDVYKARYTLCNAVRDGRIKRLPCRVCGNKKSHGHHDDYKMPLDVIWLCSIHHAELHNKKETTA